MLSEAKIEEKVLTVTELNQLVNDALADLTVSVVGEVSDYKVIQGKWVTFDLKDEQSRVNVFMVLFRVEGQIEDGMEVKVCGRPGIYSPYGKYSFRAEAVEPVGEGALARAFELTKKKLAAEGLFDIENKKPLPRFPERIGLVTSEDAAAYGDFARVLNNRWDGVEVIMYPVLVQGEGSPDQIVEAFDYFNKYDPVEVLVLTRGGGSLEDLQSFNSERVCRAIFGSNIPVVVGVGHERDMTLADLTADIRASTPSNAAERVVPDRAEMIAYINQLNQRAWEAIRRNLVEGGYKLDGLMTRLDRFIIEPREKLTDFDRRINFAINQLMSAAGEEIFRWRGLLKSLGPLEVMKRGYSMSLWRGKVLRSAGDLKEGDEIETRLAEGGFRSKVKGKI